MTDLSIVIPCYNEEKNLDNLINKCSDLLVKNPNIEIILVNNGSTDNSQSVLEYLIKNTKLDRLKTFLVPVNKGYGYGILEGLKSASSATLCWTHADLQTDVNDCLKAYDIYKKENDDCVLIKGQRKGRNAVDVLFTKLMSAYVLYKLKVQISDINAQPKLFSKTFFNKIMDKAPADFSLDLFFLLEAQKQGRIVTFPVYFHDRTAGEAKGGGSLKLKMKLTKRTIAFINNFK